MALSYVSLFSGAGVGCYGFKQENFTCIATSEIIEQRLAIQRYNDVCKSSDNYIHGDLSTLETQQHLLTSIKNSQIADVDVVIATPPCQGMSVANHKKNNELKRNSLVTTSIDLILQIKPKFFIFENVRSFLTTICTDLDGQLISIKDAINKNLSPHYNVSFHYLNFKNYSVPSSRTRTLVIGVRKDLRNISPTDLLPEEQSPILLSDTIGHLHPLKTMGEISKSDIYHNFRPYPEHMLNWIKDLKQGESAFDNSNPKNIPHRIIDNKIILNKNKNGDKYTRCLYNKVGPCIHTRNDQLASQATIHPIDNRVFSIRELMLMMTIPDDFKWSDVNLKKLNQMTLDDKQKYLKTYELNIRRCIGESVPTIIFKNIANSIKKYLIYTPLTTKSVINLFETHKLDNLTNLRKFIKNSNLDFYDLIKLIEYRNRTNISKIGTHYTSKDIAYAIVKDIPDFTKKSLNIIEPAVGSGSFLPVIFEKFKKIPEVNLDLVDIDKEILELLKLLLKKLEIPPNFNINFINADFLSLEIDKKYDIAITNPPFKKLINEKNKLAIYKFGKINTKTNNLASFFTEKISSISSYTAIILPKSIISSPEFNDTRKMLENYNINKIIDFGEFAFDVLIETIGLNFNNLKSKIYNSDKILVESYILNSYIKKDKSNVIIDKFPYWLLYQDVLFNNTLKKLELGFFKSFRDRQITKKHHKLNGQYKILRSKNLTRDGIVVSVDGYDSYTDNPDEFTISKYLDHSNILIVPNLSYYPRAAKLPSHCIVDGSLALLIPKNGKVVSQKQIDFFKTEEFYHFYKVARNYGTRSLNIDNNSVYFWGLLKSQP